MKLSKSFTTALIFLFVVFIILLVLIMYISPADFSSKNQNLMTLEQTSEIEHDLSTTPITKPVFDKGFFYITPNYASFYNTSGEMVWNEIFNLNNLVAQQSGNFVATAQYNVNSSTVYVFDINGVVYNVQPNKKVLKHSVNENGYLALIFEEGSGYQIQTYDNKGAKVLTYTFAEKNSIPVDVEISPDNKYLAIPFFNYDGLQPVSKTTFLNLNKSENDTEDAIFAGFDLVDTIPFFCKFINDHLYLFTDKQVAKYSISDGKVSEVISISVYNYINNIDFIDNKYILASYSEKISNESDIEPNTIIVYDLNGKEVSRTNPLPSLDSVTVAKAGFLAEHNNSITYFNLNCKPVFTYTVEQTINSAYVIDKNLDTILTTAKTGIYKVVR